MLKKLPLVLFAIAAIVGLSMPCFAAKIAPPDMAGDGFKKVSVADAQKMHKQGATVVACHSHSTDFMKGHPDGTVHITCMVPKDHKRVDLSLSKVLFDLNDLPADKNTAIIMYCASNT
ncbi:MAG: hypothetical protein KAI75_01255 [Desulfobulbaceae bacterium]|nr:hypothetical protein [Desulfobulbaceae bacterium]